MMTETTNKATGAKVRVKALPELSTWPACNAKKHFGIEVVDCRTLKEGGVASLPKTVAEALIERKLVRSCFKTEGGK